MTTVDGRAEPTLKPNALGFLDSLVIGLASTSPAYSLAAILGALVALTGVNAPGVLLASFVPMLLIAGAFAALNRVDPDCGTTFSWVTRAMGPWFGWIGGWFEEMATTDFWLMHAGFAAVSGAVFVLFKLFLSRRLITAAAPPPPAGNPLDRGATAPAPDIADARRLAVVGHAAGRLTRATIRPDRTDAKVLPRISGQDGGDGAAVAGAKTVRHRRCSSSFNCSNNKYATSEGRFRRGFQQQVKYIADF